jgi:YVTN family beta-propeller protein
LSVGFGPTIGAELGGYRLEALIGRGGMSAVYRAEDLRLRRRVALKFLVAELAADKRFRERFLTESRLAASIDHPNIVPIYEAGEAEGLLYIAMRYVEGTDLQALLRRDAPLDAERAVALVAQLADALDAAHARGLIHRDVKPSNVLVAAPDDHVYLADFGLTRHTSSRGGRAHGEELVGTVDYVAPEQIRGDDLDGRADLYSLGCVLHQCVTGELPFVRRSEVAVIYAHLEDAPPRASERCRSVPGALDAVIARALAKDPEDRWQTGAELASGARAALSGPPDGLALVGRHAARRRVALVAGAAAVAIGLAAGAFALLTGGGSHTVAVAPNSVAVIDPARDVVVSQVPVGARPGDIASGAGRVWVANLDDDSVSEINPRAATVERTLSTGTSVDGLTVAGDALWTMDAPDGAALRIDPMFGDVDRRVRVGPASETTITTPSPMAAGPDSVWTATTRAAVVKLAAHSRARPRRVDVGNEPTAIADGGGATWVADDFDDTVSRIDRAGVVTDTIPVGHGPSAIATGAGGVWVANTADGTVTRIDPATRASVTTIAVGAEPTGIAVGLGAVWVADSRAGSVSKIDPRSNRVVATIDVGESPDHVAVAAGRVWVTVQAGVSQRSALPAGTVRIAAGDDFNSTDPAIEGSYLPAAAQMEYATCAKLLNYPDRPAPEGTRLIPEVATGSPAVSPDGRIYTYTVRPGFRFSPPSNAPVTARAFQRALERFLSPTMQPDSNGLAPIMSGIVGYRAYRAGRTRHISGVSATGTTLTIHLRRPDPSLPTRLAMSYFCAVPPSTPIRAAGIDAVPSAGPYYVASHAPKRELVLRRNPNYRGPRPRGPAEIDYEFGALPARSVALVESGHADYASAAFGDQHSGSGASLEVRARLTRRYGPHSAAARTGRQQYFTNRTLALQYLVLNTRRPLFADVRMRKAANFAVDRAALAKYAGPGFSGVPTDQYLPTGMPGFRDAEIYPLGGPNLARARRLAGNHHHRAVMYTCNLPTCLQNAEVVRADLGAIGIDVRIKRLPYAALFQRESTRGEPFDIGWYGWSVDYPDPSDFIDVPFAAADVDFPGADEQRYMRRIADASRLAGARRLRAYGELDITLAKRAAPVVAFANLTTDDFFSPHIGCQVFQPMYGMDLAALCRRGKG